MISEASLPPAIVLGIDTPIGLTVVRELGERGVPVHGIARSVRGVGLYSRWLRRGYLRPADDAGTLQLIRKIADDSIVPFVMAVSMSDVLLLRRAADSGGLGTLRPLVAPLRQLEIVNDKSAVYQIARQLGIGTPQTWELRAEELDGGLPPALAFPCVLKWRDPEQVAPALDRNGLELEKFRYVYSTAELREVLARYRCVGQLPLIQSFAPGIGLGQMFLMYEDRAVLRFQHRRIAEFPPEGGTSAVCETIGLDENSDLLEKSEALLRRIGWCGPAMVEYRSEPAMGSAILMEINGRFWGSLPLAYHAGVPFAWATYAALGLENPGLIAAQARPHVRCRYVVPETKRLARILFHPSAIQNRELRFSRTREVVSFVVAYFRPHTHYFVFTLRDPKPFFADFAFIVRRGLASVLNSIRRRWSAVMR